VFDRDPTPALGVIERHVALERVRSRDVVVIPILPPPHEPSGSILAARDGFEFDLHRAVGDRRAVLDAPGEGALSGLLQHVGGTRRVGVSLNGPFRLPAAHRILRYRRRRSTPWPSHP